LAAPDRGLPAESRLRSSAQFKAALGSACVSRDPCFAVYARPNGLATARLGMGVSVRVARSAVARNRIKRQVREAFRAARADLPPVDVVVLARSAAAGTAGPDLRRALSRHWQRVARCSES